MSVIVGQSETEGYAQAKSEIDYMNSARENARQVAEQTGGRVIEGPHHVFVATPNNERLLQSLKAENLRVVHVGFPGVPGALEKDRGLKRALKGDYQKVFDMGEAPIQRVVNELEGQSGLKLGVRIADGTAGYSTSEEHVEHYLLLQPPSLFSREHRSVGVVSFQRNNKPQ
jgi:hypothetical protein